MWDSIFLPTFVAMNVEIDTKSGFCFGVVRAIETAERELLTGKPLYCLGDIVHNEQEVGRLTDAGLITIDHSALPELKNSRVLLRAHGEPPATYATLKENGIELIDATCPVVLKLQQKIKKAYAEHPEAQIVIFGKKGHAEVIGLVGQTDGKAIVLENGDDLERIDFSKPVIMFSQTTKSIEAFNRMAEMIAERIAGDVHFECHDTICRQVANRIPYIREFASRYDCILFVAGEKSSNGKVLYNECKAVNPDTHRLSSADEIDMEWFAGKQSVGICGATSTPKWLMEEVAAKVMSL